MRAILITGLTVKEVTIDPNNIDSFNKLLDCRIFTSAGYPDETHAAYVDDEGLLNLTDGSFLYEVQWYPQELAGNILITGFDPSNGETVPATMTVGKIYEFIQPYMLQKP